jgi:hypothetical protein
MAVAGRGEEEKAGMGAMVGGVYSLSTKINIMRSQILSTLTKYI